MTGPSSRNGFAFATQTVGSHIGTPSALGSGCHTPTPPVPNVHPIGTALLCPLREHRRGGHLADRLALLFALVRNGRQ